MKLTKLLPLAAALALILGSASLSGASLTYSGNLTNPNTIFEAQFTLSMTENLTISTNSVASGGFDAVLWLFNSTGTTQLAKNDPPAGLDATISEPNFAAGTYDLFLSAWDQHYCVANTICNSVVYGNTGWSYNGLTNFGGRTSAYAVTITTDQTEGLTAKSSGVNSEPPRAFPAETIPTSVPEPGSAALLLTTGAFLAFKRLRTPGFRAALARKRSASR